VIDSGRVKRMAYDGVRALSSLQDVRISQVSARVRVRVRVRARARVSAVSSLHDVSISQA